MKPTWSSQANSRGQVVLLAALVLAVALVPMVVAYLQLGYDGDVHANVEEDTERDAERLLERTINHAADGIPERYDWSERSEAAETVRDRLASTQSALGHSRLDEGVTYELAYNESRANRWATQHCPGGTNRQFGECESINGVVVQDRDGKVHVLAVAADITVTTPESERKLTTVKQVQTK